MWSHICNSIMREKRPSRTATLTGWKAASLLASLSWKTIALMMTSAAMFAASSPGSAPKTFDTLTKVPGEE